MVENQPQSGELLRPRPDGSAVVKGEKARVLVADDHLVVRKGVRAILEIERDIVVVGEARDGIEALALCRELEPDIVLLDIAMPGMSGIEVARQVQREQPQTRIILLTMHEEDEYFFEAVAVGVAGYVVKGASADELLFAIRSVQQGGIYLYPSLAKKLVTDYLRGKTTAAYEGLTPREREVLGLIVEGLPNKQIAERLYVSITTVQTHRAHVMEKLNLHSQAELVKYAIRKGILKPEG